MTKEQAIRQLEYLLSVENGVWRGGCLSPYTNDLIVDNIRALTIAIKCLRKCLEEDKR